MKDTGKTIFFVTFIAMLTKVIALISILMYQSHFGLLHTELKIFSYSLNIPNYIFTAIGTSLTTIVIPIYSSSLAQNDNKRADKFIHDLTTLTSIIVIGLIIITYIITPIFVNFTGYKNNPTEYNYAVSAVRNLIPVMFFFSLRDIFSGVLQSNHKFKMVAAISLPSSIITILYVIFFADKFGVTGLIGSSLIGLSLQPIFLWPALRKTGYKYKFSIDYKSKDIISGVKLIPTVLLGVSAYQINMLYNNNLSTMFGTENIINIVLNIMLIPVITLINSITSIYYPRMSEEWNNNKEDYKSSLKEIISVITFLLIPATVGLLILRYDVMNLLVKWNKVTENEISLASNILGLYSLGIVSVGLKETFDKALYAQKVTLPSGITGIIIMTSNIVISLLLKDSLGTYCIPIAYTLSSLIGVLVLFGYLIKNTGKLTGEVYTNMLKSFLSACIMGIAVYGISFLCKSFILTDSFLGRLIILIIPVVFGIVIYFISAYIFKIKQAIVVFSKIKSLGKVFFKRGTKQ